MATVFFSPGEDSDTSMVLPAASTLLTSPPKPCLCHSSRSRDCFSVMSAFFMAMTEVAATDLPSSASLPRTRIRSPGCRSANWMGVASFKSFWPGAMRTSFAESWTRTVTSVPPSVVKIIVFPEIDLIVPTGRAEAGACAEGC